MVPFWPVAIFVAVAFAWTSGTRLPWILSGDDLPLAIHLLSALGPALGAVAAALAESPARLRTLAARLGQKPAAGWLWAGAGTPLLALLLGLAIAAAAGDLVLAPAFSDPAWWLFRVLASSAAFGIFEEIGWRGYLQPRLQSRIPVLLAVLAMTVIWFLWHVPMFFTWLSLGPVELIAYFLGLLGGTAWLAFLLNGARGALLPVMLWHALFDVASISGGETGTVAVAVISLVPLGLGLAALVLGRAQLSWPDRDGQRVPVRDVPLPAPITSPAAP